jgi:hypothetical protein
MRLSTITRRLNSKLGQSRRPQPGHLRDLHHSQPSDICARSSRRKPTSGRNCPFQGRSQPSIINLANYLIDWVMNEHPAEEVRDALAPPYVQPTAADDPQPNPPDDPATIHFVSNRFTPEEELKAVIDSLARWLPENADKTVAVLVPRNTRGVDVINALKARGLDYVEFLSSTSTTRAAAGSIANLLGYPFRSRSRLANCRRLIRSGGGTGEMKMSRNSAGRVASS